MKRCAVGLVGLLALSVLPVLASGRRLVEVYPEVIAPIAADWQKAIDEAFLRAVSDETARIVQEGPKAEEEHYSLLQLVRMPRAWGRYEPHPLLSRLFPAVTFYNLLSAQTIPETRYLKGYANGKFYDLPGEFNRMLLDQGQEMNDRNILDLAKAFVVIALMDQYGKAPQITFLEERRVRERISGISYEAKLTVKINDQIEEWYFDMSYGQFGVISRGNNKGLIYQYDLPIFEKPPEKRGDLDLPHRIDIATTPPSDAYVEWENDSTPHYYLIVDTNGQATDYQVKFDLSGFPPNARNVYLRIIDTIWAGVRLLTRVEINDSGKGSFLWTPSTELTGICKVGAGFADTLNPLPTYQDSAKPRKELTLEKVITDTFPNSVDNFALYYTDQFLYNRQNQPPDTAFVTYTRKAIVASWGSLVNKWNFDPPPDVRHLHKFFLGDSGVYYHGKLNGAYAKSSGGEERRIRVADEIPYMPPFCNYPSQDLGFLSCVSHEFYHGIQWGYNGWKTKYLNWKEWNYFLEGQAVFIQSVMCPEEMNGSWRYYPIKANSYLTLYKNSSLRDTTNNSAVGYSFCLYWRFLFEKYLGMSGATPSDSARLAIIREAYRATANVGSDPIVDGAHAMDSVLAAHQGVFSSFVQSIDAFACACYLKDFNSSNVYFEPALTARQVIPGNGDSVVINDSIPCSFGIDYIVLVPDTAAGEMRFSFLQNTSGTDPCIFHRQLIIFPKSAGHNVVHFGADTMISLGRPSARCRLPDRCDLGIDELFNIQPGNRYFLNQLLPPSFSI